MFVYTLTITQLTSLIDEIMDVDRRTNEQNAMLYMACEQRATMLAK